LLERRQLGLERSGTHEQHRGKRGRLVNPDSDRSGFYNGVAFCFTGAAADNDATAAASGVAIPYARGKR
jgi:hypothetical protein